MNRQLLWYDVHEKQMHTFYGGQLKFNYVGGRMLPTVEPLYALKKTSVSSIWQIRSWFEANSDEYKLTIVEDSPTHLTFAFTQEAQKEDVEAVENALYGERFDFFTEKHKNA